MNRKHFIFRSFSRLAAGLVVASGAIVSNGHATDIDYKPASLVKGHCGHDSLVIAVDGKHQTVSCSHLDTYTGRGHYEMEVCYKEEHKRKHGKHNKHGRHGRGHKHHYQRCEVVKHHYQLPVIKVEKRAYDAHKNLISTADSSSFSFHMSTNGGYSHAFKLNSKQKYYVIPSNDTYTIAENAPHYNTVIDCGAGQLHKQTVDVKIDKPGQQVSCVFNNYMPKRHHDKKHDDKKHHDNKKPMACMVNDRSLESAKHRYAKHCHQPRKDCDYMHGKWYCSSEKIGKYAPAKNDNGRKHQPMPVHKPKPVAKPKPKPVAKPKPVHKPKPKPVAKPKPVRKPLACVVEGSSLERAKHSYAKHCHQPRKDCDPMHGKWYCSSEKIGKYAPSSVKNRPAPAPVRRPPPPAPAEEANDIVAAF